MAFTTSAGSGSPNPHACEINRFRCKPTRSSTRVVAKSPNPESNARLEKLVRTLKRAKKKAEGERRPPGAERSEEELKNRPPGRPSPGLEHYGKSRRSPVQNRRVTIRATWGGSPGVDGD